MKRGDIGSDILALTTYSTFWTSKSTLQAVRFGWVVTVFSVSRFSSTQLSTCVFLFSIIWKLSIFLTYGLLRQGLCILRKWLLALIKVSCQGPFSSGHLPHSPWAMSLMTQAIIQILVPLPPQFNPSIEELSSYVVGYRKRIYTTGATSLLQVTSPSFLAESRPGLCPFGLYNKP